MAAQTGDCPERASADPTSASGEGGSSRSEQVAKKDGATQKAGPPLAPSAEGNRLFPPFFVFLLSSFLVENLERETEL